MKERIPWTRDDLNYIVPRLEKELSDEEQLQRESQLPGQEEVRPLPPMTIDECKDYIWRLVETAKERTLTSRECFIFGQLMEAFEQCVMAKMLGKKGRYYVIDEQHAMEMIKTLGD